MNEWDIAVASIKAHWKGLILALLIGFLVAVITLIFQKPVYEGHMIIAPTERTGIPNLTSFLPQQMNEAPVLQYFVERLDASNDNDFTTFQAILNGPQIADYLEQTYPDILPSDEQSARWVANAVKIRPFGTSNYKKVTVRHHNPQFAAKLLNVIFQETDNIIRQNALKKTNRRITYLKEELKTTRHPDHRDAMIALLKEQERTAMTVAIDHYFAAIPIQHPYVSMRPAAPDWRLVFPVCLFIGAILGLIISHIASAFRRT